MHRILLTLATLFVFIACSDSKNKTSLIGDPNDSIPAESSNRSTKNFGIVLHGGAGTILKENVSDSMENAYKTKLEEAIRAGYAILEKGGDALDAVTATINILEDSPLFNSARGAVFTHEGRNELDASIMDGSNLNAGAVAGVRHIKNPINLARDVMDKSPHVMLYGAGAEEFAQGLGYEMMDTTYFYTQEQYDVLQKVIKRQKEKEARKVSVVDPAHNDYKFGTVGAAALDKNGNLAAGTSTGGMTNKRWNRIGDSPIIGAGTYANNATCAISATGWGEYFIRTAATHDISALMEYKNLSLKDAAKEVIGRKIPALGGDGGIVAIDRNGNIAMEFNTQGMFRASLNSKNELVIGLYKDAE